jgi:RHS repeat-associated protein
MHRPLRFVALTSVLFIACHGDGSSDSPSGDEATSSTTSAVLKPPLTVPANTIVTETAGVLAPKGDGTVGVDDRGQAHEHIPIWVPPGRAGIEPTLSVDYMGGGGNGLLGAGWGVGGLSRITRCQALRKNGNISQPIEWNSNDGLCLDGEPLTPDASRVLGGYYYKFHSDGSLIAAYSVDGTTAFKMFEKDGRIITFGGTTDSRVIASRFMNTPQTMTWAVSRIEDRAGNFMTYTYDLSTGGDLRPKRIDYTGSPSDATKRSVTFTYETRPDVDYRMFGQQIFTYPDRLHSIEMHAPNTANLDPLRTMTFGYSTSPVTGRSLLSKLAECDGPAPTTLPVTGSVPLCRQQTFTYAPGVPAGASGAYASTNLDSNNQPITDVSTTGAGGVLPVVKLLDVNGDGRDDVLYLSNDPSATYHLRLSTPTGFGPAILTGIAASGGSSGPIVLDFNMDGHADILVNQGPESSPASFIYLANKTTTGWTLGGPGYYFQLQSGFKNYQVADIDGNGMPDLVTQLDGNAYYSINLDGTAAHLTNPVEFDDQQNTDYINAPNNYFIDFNNDGVTDVMTRRWASTTCKNHHVDLACTCDTIGFGVLDISAWLYPTYSNPTPTTSTTVNGIKYCDGPPPEDSTYGHLFGDFNGDGYVDTIETLVPYDATNPDQPMQLKLMLGGGTQSFNTTTPGGTFTLTNPAVGFQTLDADGDGKTDLLVRDGSNTPYKVYSWKNEAWQVTPIVLGEPEATGDLNAFTTGDVDGDGQTDIVALDGNGYLDLYTRNSGSAPADLLTATIGEFTPRTTVAYAPHRIAGNENRSDCVWPLTCVTRSGYLVSSVSTDNGLNGGVNTQTHSYDSGRADLLGWGFLGFKLHSFTDLATGAVTARTFDFTRNNSGMTPFYPFVGMPTEVDTTIVYKSGATSVTRTTKVTNQYSVQGAGPFMTTPINTHTEVSDSNFAGDIDVRNTSRGFDEFGNETFERTQYFTSAEEVDTTTTYANDTTSYIIGRPTYVSTTSKTNITFTGSTSSTHDTAYTYDALGQLVVTIDNPGAANGSSYDPLPPQSDGVQTLYTRITRDAHGLPHIVEKLDNLAAPTVDRLTQYDYDQAEGMFVVQTTDPANLVTQAAYDPGLGVVAVQSDPAGLLTTFQYDTFGRIRADHPPAGGGRIVAYNAATSGNFGTIDDHRSGQYKTRAYLDSLRRTTKTVTTGRADGKSVYVETTYDKFGNIKTVSRPHFSGVTPAKTITTYDNLGRVTLIQGADNSTVSTSYLGRTVTTTNADGNMSAVTNDSLGRPLTSTQAKTTGSSGLSGPVTTTTLAYGPFNTQVSSTDTLGNVVSYVYDRTGRLRWKRSPDSNATAYKYDVFGEVSQQFLGTTPIPVFFNGHTSWVFDGGTSTQLGYDADGRVTTETTDDGEQIVRTYDTAMPGKLSTETITNGPTIAFTYYPTTGELHTKTWAGPRGAIGYNYSYDGYGRLSTMSYPALAGNRRSMVLRYTYSGSDIGGQLTKVDDVSSASTINLWTLVSTDASESFPVEQLFYGLQTTRTEDPLHPGWLHTIGATSGTTTVQSLRYTREGGGRVKMREDLVPTTPTVETFGYDGLERLTSWTWNGAAGARGANYVYDDIGNLRQRNITAGPGTSVTYTPGPSPSSEPFGPHQNASDSLGTTYDYDSLGEQLSGPGRTFTWNEFGRPASVTSAAGSYQLTYDPELARFSRTDPTGHTRYSYGGLFDEFSDESGTHDVLTVMAGGKPVGELEINNNITLDAPRSALLTDALGSIDTIYLGSSAQPVKYDPFGTRVSATDPTVPITAPPQDLRAGFTGHNHDDDVNLIDMVGRVYDPQQQRFLSVDPPAPDPVDGQAYNPYAYVRNNPLNATDPTGYYEVTLEGSYMGNDGQDAYGVWSSATPGMGHQNVVSVFGLRVLVVWATQWTGNTQGPDANSGPTGASTALLNTSKESDSPEKVDNTDDGDGTCLCKRELNANILPRIATQPKDKEDNGYELGYGFANLELPLFTIGLQVSRRGDFVLQLPTAPSMNTDVAEVLHAGLQLHWRKLFELGASAGFGFVPAGMTDDELLHDHMSGHSTTLSLAYFGLGISRVDVGRLHGFEVEVSSPGAGISDSYGVPLGNPRNWLNSIGDRIHEMGRAFGSMPAQSIFHWLPSVTGNRPRSDDGQSPW